MPHLRLLLVTLASFVALAFAGVAPAFGAIIFDGSAGTGPPPDTLGTCDGRPQSVCFKMRHFRTDPTPDYSSVDSVTAPNRDVVSFSPSLQHLIVGNGWNTWSNGYTGDVYYSGGGSVTLTMPADTSAFYLYAEPNPYAVFEISATADNGTTSGPIPVDGYYGAQFFGFYGTAGDHIASITVSSSIDFAIGEFGIDFSGKYVALGDSYSSGEGNPPFEAGTDGPSDYCHRSPQAYSHVLADNNGLDLNFYACSGAVTSDITSTFHDTEPPQITRPGVDTTADLVTMTIGGNDAGFSDVLKACIEQKLKADAYNALIGPIGQWLGFGHDPSCAHSDSFTSSVDTQIDNVFWPAKLTELQLLGAVDPQQTSVIVADYPKLFPDSVPGVLDGCILSVILTGDDMTWMNGEGDRLDNVLAQAAAQAGVNFVDVRGAFAGHEICGPAGAWLNGISFASGSGGSCTLSVLGHCIISGLPIVGSFHPNAAGHADGYAASIQSLIDSAPDTTDAGFPSNPPAAPDPPGSPAPTVDGIGDLAVTPVSTATPACPGTYVPGQAIHVSGGGFAAGAAVQIYVSAAGLSDTGELLVGTATADANGNVSSTVTIPQSASGFTPDGAAAGMAFVDAIGTGAVAEHLDDVAMTGLAPADSTCAIPPFTFDGFKPPVSNLPQVNAAQPGRAVPVKFSLPGSNGTLGTVLASGYPQSAPVSCTSPQLLTTGDATTQIGDTSTTPGDDYNYVWKTDKTWTGCRELIVKLVDGSYHRAVFDFGT